MLNNITDPTEDKIPVKIKNIEELISICSDNKTHSCFVLLPFGIRRTKKIFMNENGIFSIINEIDSSEDNLSEKELKDPSLSSTGKALHDGVFYTYKSFEKESL